MNSHQRIFGKIENTPLDISMTSSPTTFSSVEPKGDATFPGSLPSTSELRVELQRTRVTAIAGIVVGAVEALMGGVAPVMLWARRKGFPA